MIKITTLRLVAVPQYAAAVTQRSKFSTMSTLSSFSHIISSSLKSGYSSNISYATLCGPSIRAFMNHGNNFSLNKDAIQNEMDLSIPTDLLLFYPSGEDVDVELVEDDIIEQVDAVMQEYTEQRLRIHDANDVDPEMGNIWAHELLPIILNGNVVDVLKWETKELHHLRLLFNQASHLSSLALQYPRPTPDYITRVSKRQLLTNIRIAAKCYEDYLSHWDFVANIVGYSFANESEFLDLWNANMHFRTHSIGFVTSLGTVFLRLLKDSETVRPDFVKNWISLRNAIIGKDMSEIDAASLYWAISHYQQLRAWEQTEANEQLRA